MFTQLLQQIDSGNYKALARCISLVENEYNGYYSFLQQLPPSSTPIIGITGPPGAGKSTLVDAIIEQLVTNNKKVGVLCIDPSSPFNLGALLGDRIRMSNWYNHQNVFIRSLATRGSLGGLHPKIIEITDVMKAAAFDYIIVETVGVGQSEIEIAGLADCTIVVLVPEAGDEIQTMKAGLMEIANIFVVNKSDRPDADSFIKNLRMMLAPAFQQQQMIEIVKTVAIKKEGIEDLVTIINNYCYSKLLQNNSAKKAYLLTEKAFQIIEQHKMKDISKTILHNNILLQYMQPNFNLYKFVKQYF